MVDGDVNCFIGWVRVMALSVRVGRERGVRACSQTVLFLKVLPKLSQCD